jgi:hypothetical protein
VVAGVLRPWRYHSQLAGIGHIDKAGAWWVVAMLLESGTGAVQASRCSACVDTDR